MFMTRINHKIDKNHTKNIFFPFLPNLYQILSKIGSKRAPPLHQAIFGNFSGFFVQTILETLFLHYINRQARSEKLTLWTPFR